MDKLRCQICGKVVENALPILEGHIATHIGNYEEEAEIEKQSLSEWILSYFDAQEDV